MRLRLGEHGKTYNGKKKGGSEDGAEGPSGELLLVRGVPVKIVGHEENVRSRWDEGMARFHNLKAQETEGTHQFSCKRRGGVKNTVSQNRDARNTYRMVVYEDGVLGLFATYHDHLCSCKSRQTR